MNSYLFARQKYRCQFGGCGQTEKYLDLVSGYCRRTLDECAACFSVEDESGDTIHLLPDFAAALDALTDTLQPFLDTLADDSAHAEVQKELAEDLSAFHADVEVFQQAIPEQEAAWKQQKTTNGDLKRVLIARIEEFLRAMGGLFAFVGS